jgi:hypothetical protein
MALKDDLKRRMAGLATGNDAMRDPNSITIRVPRKARKGPVETPAPYVKRDPATGKILPGASLNPLGSSRAGALSRFAADLTGGGEELIAMLLLIARGELEVEIVTPRGEIEWVGPTVKERMAAAEALLDRVAGKAPAFLAVDTANAPAGQPNALEGQPLEVKIAAAELFRKMLQAKQEEPQETQAVTVDVPVLPA